VNWKRTANPDPATKDAFPWAIMKGNTTVALVATEFAAKRIAAMQTREQQLEGETGRYRVLYLGASATRGRK
jgi:hypothetical protein